MQPATVDLRAARWTPFVHQIEVQGVDLTGAAFAAAIRQKPDWPGAPLVALAGGVPAGAEGVRLAYGGTDTIANHIIAGRLSVAPAGMADNAMLPLSIIEMRVNEATMEDPTKIPFPHERGDEHALHWDMHVTPSAGIKQVWFRGAFTVEPGDVQ